MYYLGRVCRGSPAPPTGHGEKGASELEFRKQGHVKQNQGAGLRKALRLGKGSRGFREKEPVCWGRDAGGGDMGVGGHGMRGTRRKYREAGLSAGRRHGATLGVCVWKPRFLLKLHLGVAGGQDEQDSPPECWLSRPLASRGPACIVSAREAGVQNCVIVRIRADTHRHRGRGRKTSPRVHGS